MGYKILPKGLSEYVTYPSGAPAATQAVVSGPVQVSGEAAAVTTAGISALAVPIGIGALVLAGLYAVFGKKKKKRKARRAYAR